MATYLHLGGDLSGQLHDVQDTLSYVSPGGDTYVLAKMTDGTEVYAEGSLCWRDAKNFYIWYLEQNPNTQLGANAPSTATPAKATTSPGTSSDKKAGPAPTIEE